MKCLFNCRVNNHIRPSSQNFHLGTARIFGESAFPNFGGSNLPFVSSDINRFYQSSSSNVLRDGREQDFNFFTFLDGTSGSLGPEPGQNPISANEFLNFVGNQSLRDIQHHADPPGGSIADSRAAGPLDPFRYVIDPGNALAVIDMRHFLVVGEVGNIYGIGIELFQFFTGDKSAFNPQDLYSNILGTDFFRTYDYGKRFEPQLREYFQNRGQVN